MRASWAIILLLLFATASAITCRAQTCTVGSAAYIVMSQTQVAIKCNATPASISGWTASLTTTSGATLNGTVSRIQDNDQWLQIDIVGTRLVKATAYQLILSVNGVAQPPIPVSTTSSYSVAKGFVPAQYNIIRLQSNVLVSKSVSEDCSLAITTAYAPMHNVPLRGCTIRPTVYGGQLSMEAMGEIEAITKEFPPYQVTPNQLLGFQDIFGVTPSIASTARIAAIKPPASKDLSSYYFNLTFLGATGSSPAFTIDGKVVPQIVPGLYGGFEINPLVLAANTGQGTISTAKFTDTIDFGSNAARSFEPHNRLLEAWVFTPGFNAETDKAFDTWNALGTIDAKFNFKGLYNPQIRGRLRRFTTKLASDPKATLDDVPQFYQPWGFVLEAHTLLEVGTKIGDSVVKNSAKTESMTLPQYSILRPSLELHTIIQYKRASVDWMTTGRYLAMTEQSVLEHKDKTLYLYAFHRAKAYQVLTGAY